jgi:hypothetical protein
MKKYITRTPMSPSVRQRAYSLTIFDGARGTFEGRFEWDGFPEGSFSNVEASQDSILRWWRQPSST